MCSIEKILLFSILQQRLSLNSWSIMKWTKTTDLIWPTAYLPALTETILWFHMSQRLQLLLIGLATSEKKMWYKYTCISEKILMCMCVMYVIHIHACCMHVRSCTCTFAYSYQHLNSACTNASLSLRVIILAPTGKTGHCAACCASQRPRQRRLWRTGKSIQGHLWRFVQVNHNAVAPAPIAHGWR